MRLKMVLLSPSTHQPTVADGDENINMSPQSRTATINIICNCSNKRSAFKLIIIT